MISQQLKQNALYRYPAVLKTRRAELMKQLKLKTPGQDERSVWEMSLVLNYMIETQEKYIRLLKLLAENKLAVDMLKRFYDGLATDPSVDVNQFVAEAQEIMQSKAFQSDIMKLTRKFNILVAASLLSALLLSSTVIILLFTYPLAVALLSLLVWQLKIVGMLLFVAAITLFIVGQSQNVVMLNIERANDSLLDDKNKPLYQLKDAYSYETVDPTDDCLISTEIRQTPKPQAKSQLRERFFQPDGLREPLSESVRREFSNSL